jgi:antitoxin component YwqK of YwqJK toxin-antitoxin module
MAVSSEIGSRKVTDMGEAKKYSLAGNVKIEYWDNGKPRVLTESNDLDDVVGIAYFRNDGTLEQEKTFDDRGKTLSMAYFNSRGGLKAGADGWAAMVCKYDNGIMRGQGYYDSSGQLKRYLIYNSSGDLVCKKYIGDEEPDPTELYSNSATTSQAPQSFEFYDSYGRPTGKVTSYTGDDWFPYSYPYWHYHGYPIGIPG